MEDRLRERVQNRACPFERRLISAEWGLSENNRKARYYELTREGRRELRAQESVWRRYVVAVSKVLQPVAEG